MPGVETDEESGAPPDALSLGSVLVAVGAAVATPDRPVLAIQADGSAMYTISALWSHAREQLDITTIVCDNGSYAILEHELSRVGARGTVILRPSCHCACRLPSSTIR